MIVGVLRVSLLCPEGDSLKGKRKIVQKIKERVRSKFNASVAEVGDNELWQRITLGISVVGNESPFVNSQLDRILDFIDQLYLARILDHAIELIPFGDGFDDDLGDPEW
ncbi:MAG: DUF503 domain-containing protein [Deltaproteobacteria bacterium]|nr:MAG: DUF503 domain-containing protein [Deltaproteobacteria bacterium]